MTRPRTGQRKLGTAPVMSRLADALSVGTAVASRAVAGLAATWVGAAVDGCGLGCAAAAGAGRAPRGGALPTVLLAAGRTPAAAPGMVSFWPTRRLAEAAIWLARASSTRDLP